MASRDAAKRKLRPFEQAAVQLRRHYLLGPVAAHLAIRARYRSETEWPATRVCPRAAAQRPLPSIVMAMWRGRVLAAAPAIKQPVKNMLLNLSWSFRKDSTSRIAATDLLLR